MKEFVFTKLIDRQLGLGCYGNALDKALESALKAQEPQMRFFQPGGNGQKGLTEGGSWWAA